MLLLVNSIPQSFTGKVMNMEEYGFDFRHALAVMGSATFAVCAGSVLAGYPGLTSGLLLGCIGSIAYFMLISYQMQRGVSMPGERARRYLQGGWVPRFCLVGFFILLAIRIPQMDMIAVIAGLFLPFRTIILFNGIALWIRDFKQADEKAAVRKTRKVYLPEPASAISRSGWPWTDFFTRMYSLPHHAYGAHRLRNFHM